MELKIFTDGGARGNPGPAAVGVVIQDDKGKVIHQFGKKIGHATNNMAEYQAVVEALEYLRVQGSRFNLPAGKAGVQGGRIDFFLDSKLVVNQLNGLYKIKSAPLREMVFKIRGLEQELGVPIYYHFCPRESNSSHILAENELF